MKFLHTTKHIKTVLLLALLALGNSCTKEELEIVSTPPEFNEQSVEYQRYLLERASSYIKSFRFDKVAEIKPRITDAALRASLDELYAEYRTIADNEALYYVTPDNDSLFFVLPSYTEPDRLTRTEMQIWPRLDASMPLPVARGVLQGFKNYPMLKTVQAGTFADEYKELDLLTELEEIALGTAAEDLFQATFPGETFPIFSPKADLSQNSKLKRISLGNINLDNIIIPGHKTDRLIVSNIDLNSSLLKEIKTKFLWLRNFPNVKNNEFTLKNNNIDQLSIDTQREGANPIKKVDISETQLKNVSIDEIPLEEITLNEGLDTLQLRLRDANLKSAIQFPVSLEVLKLERYAYPLDLSQQVNLEKLTIYMPYPEKDYWTNIVYPPNLVRLVLTGNSVSGVIDLSKLDRLKGFEIHGTYGGEKLEEIIFPPNLVEAEINDTADQTGTGNHYYTRVSGISRDCKLTNMPDWFEKYISFSN